MMNSEKKDSFSMQTVAIVGAGLGGLACCWHLLQKQPGLSITLFASDEIGKGVSGTAAGLLHPFAGKYAPLNWKGKEGLESTKELIHIAESKIGCQIATQQGVLRLTQNPKQLEAFQKTAADHKEAKLLSAEECKEKTPGFSPAEGLFIPKGMQVNCPLYLKGLWKACNEKGATFQKQKIASLDSLSSYDVVIVAAGPGIKHFPEFNSLRLNLIKGQLLEFNWPSNLPPLPQPVSATTYFAPNPQKQSFFLGATFERHFSHPDPDPEEAKRLLLPKAASLFPYLKTATIQNCTAGVRVSAPLHRPSFGQIRQNLYYLTGLGSKGLLYHSLIAKELVATL